MNWIKITDRLPEEKKPVLIWAEYEDIPCIAYMTFNSVHEIVEWHLEKTYIGNSYDVDFDVWGSINYWAELPETPYRKI